MEATGVLEEVSEAVNNNNKNNNNNNDWIVSFDEKVQLLFSSIDNKFTQISI